MKTVFTLLVFLSLGIAVRAQSHTTGFLTYQISCSDITTLEASNSVKEYLLTNYPDRITVYVADLDEKSASITCNVEPIDLLQLYRAQGYIATYIGADAIYRLNDMGDLMIPIKE